FLCPIDHLPTPILARGLHPEGALPRCDLKRPNGDIMRNKQKGFSLIELLIVVAIILIIAAIAIPNLLRSKMAANQASAVASLRTLNTSSVLFYTNYGIYPSALSNLAPVGSSGTVTSTLADRIY